tara:strand:- start:1257 stop:2036 length:780 start_codon:yes stop_codon:yes gene_type:complete
MKSKLIISQALFDKLNRLDFTQNIWTDNSINSYSDLADKILLFLNNYNTKINVQSIESGDTGHNSSNYGFFVDIDTGNKLAYFFSIPPQRSSRTAFLAQDVYPALTSIIQNCIESVCNDVYNKPVFVVNLNEETITESMKINIKGALTIGLHYLDLFNREIQSKYNSLSGLDEDLINVNRDNQNQYFSINNQDKEVEFLANTLSSNTNDRYYYASKVFPAAQLAIVEKYSLITTILDAAPNTDNNTLNAFKAYVQKIRR